MPVGVLSHAGPAGLCLGDNGVGGVRKWGFTIQIAGGGRPCIGPLSTALSSRATHASTSLRARRARECIHVTPVAMRLKKLMPAIH